MTCKDTPNDVIRSLTVEPRKDVRCWDHYYINNYNFHTYSYRKNKSSMNYGVSVKGVDGVEYYGILQEVIELTCLGTHQLYKTIIFKCNCFDSTNGVNILQHYKLVDVNHTKKYFVISEKAYLGKYLYCISCICKTTISMNFEIFSISLFAE